MDETLDAKHAAKHSVRTHLSARKSEREREIKGQTKRYRVQGLTEAQRKTVGYTIGPIPDRCRRRPGWACVKMWRPRRAPTHVGQQQTKKNCRTLYTITTIPTAACRAAQEEHPIVQQTSIARVKQRTGCKGLLSARNCSQPCFVCVYVSVRAGVAVPTPKKHIRFY